MSKYLIGIDPGVSGAVRTYTSPRCRRTRRCASLQATSSAVAVFRVRRLPSASTASRRSPVAVA